MRKGMRGAILPGRFGAIALGASAWLWLGGVAYAEDASSWRELETKYIFGFTTGSGIGLEGEKEFTIDTIGRFGKRDGHYAATETKYEFEFTPSQFVQIEFGALGSTHNIGAVTDLDGRNQAAFSGGFAEFRYLAHRAHLEQSAVGHGRIRTQRAADRRDQRRAGAQLRIRNHRQRRSRTDEEPALCRVQSALRARGHAYLVRRHRARSDVWRLGGAVGSGALQRGARRRGLVSPPLRLPST